MDVTRDDVQFHAVEREMGFARGDREALLLVGMEVLGDLTAGHAGPVEAHHLAIALLACSRVLDPLPGGSVEERPKPAGSNWGTVTVLRDLVAGRDERARHEAVPFAFRYQASVSATAVWSRVPVAPKVVSYFVVSRTNGSSNS